jgi:hypothetical protein
MKPSHRASFAVPPHGRDRFFLANAAALRAD